MLKGVIFDLDGTIALTQQLHELAYAAVFKKFGIDYTRSEDFYEAGIGGDHTFKVIFGKHGVQNFNLEECKTDKRNVYAEILEGAIQNNEVKPVSGIGEFLRYLQTAGIPFIVASGNRFEFVEKTLLAVGLREYFTDIITNKDVKRGKPDPEIFLTAAKRIKCSPVDCMVFEDAWSGITAAKKAGMYCVALATLGSEEILFKSGADLVIRDYFDPRLKTIFDLVGHHAET